MGRLRVGLIGCGAIAQQTHLPVLGRLAGAELVALAETDPRRREEARKHAPRAVAVTGYPELLARPEVEAVVICAPTALHAEIAIAALEAGKHVYLEKPIATSLDEAERVLAAWRRAGVVGMTGFNYRFNALYQSARKHLQSGALGEPVSARSVFSLASPELPAWKQARRSGGGVLLDLASHHVDLIRFLFQEPVVEVYAGVQSRRSEDDTATLLLRLRSGLSIHSFFSLSAVEEESFEIYGTGGKLIVNRGLYQDAWVASATQRGARGRRIGNTLRTLLRASYVLEKLRAPGHEPSHGAALAAFVAAASAHRQAAPDLQDGYASLAVIAAAEASVRSGRAVSLAPFPFGDYACSNR